MYIESYTITDLRKIKRRLDDGESLESLGIIYGFREDEHNDLINRIIKEIGATETLLKLQKNE